MSIAETFPTNYPFLEHPIPVTEQVWSDDVPPLVSIECRTFMHEKFIGDAIEGFLMQQTTFKIEILINDDASTDKTADVIRRYEAKYPQLFKTTYQVENQHRKSPRTPKYIKRPKKLGKYIARCEGDDYWTHPLKLQMQVDFLEANPSYILCFHACEVVFEGDLNFYQAGVQQDIETREYTGKDLLKKWIIQLATVMYRNKYNIEQIKPKHKDLINREIHMFLALAEKGRLYGMSEKMSVYRKHPGGITQVIKDTATKIKFLKNYIAMDVVYNYKYHDILKVKIAKHSFKIAKDYLKQFNPKALKYFYISLKYDKRVLLGVIKNKL